MEEQKQESQNTFDPNKIKFKKRHHDDEGYDEVSITPHCRWKTSGLSGDEWRISYSLKLKRKGYILYERAFSSLDAAAAFVAWGLKTAGEGEGYDMSAYKMTEKLCAQPGCCEAAIITYKLKKEYSREGMSQEPTFTSLISFCEKHKRRGDCGLEDSDQNYEATND